MTEPREPIVPPVKPIVIQRRAITHVHADVEELSNDPVALRAHMEAEHTPGEQTRNAWQKASDDVVVIMHNVLHEMHKDDLP